LHWLFIDLVGQHPDFEGPKSENHRHGLEEILISSGQEQLHAYLIAVSARVARGVMPTWQHARPHHFWR
jgi:hypothetical protein